MNTPITPRSVTVMRYIVPLREGGSLPALAEADDDFKYVLKFKGSGHGSKMLIAELLGAKIAEALALPIPEVVFAHLDVDFGRTEADEEIQDLLKFSEGLNLGLHYLSGAIAYEPSIAVDPLLASKIVWFDAFITNIDRTFKNTNLLWWHKELWLIDHGAAFYFQHSHTPVETAAKSPFKFVSEHVLLPYASELEAAHAFAKKQLNSEVFEQMVNLIPEEWLIQETENPNELSPEQWRAQFILFLNTRLAHADLFLTEAQDARS